MSTVKRDILSRPEVALKTEKFRCTCAMWLADKLELEPKIHAEQTAAAIGNQIRSAKDPKEVSLLQAKQAEFLAQPPEVAVALTSYLLARWPKQEALDTLENFRRVLEAERGSAQSRAKAFFAGEGLPYEETSVTRRFESLLAEVKHLIEMAQTPPMILPTEDHPVLKFFEIDLAVA